MANFSALIASIEAYVKQNGNNAITGDGLQDILVAMVNSIGGASNEVAADLAAEVTTRGNADYNLQQSIAAEAQAREGAVNGEAYQRTQADNALQTAINAIKNNIDNGFVYAGIATPSGTPVSGKVFYLTAQAGTYTNYGGLVVPTGINVLKYDGTNWSQEQVISMEDIYRNPLMGYYECDTAGATAAKEVAAAGYVLPTTGGSVKIKMANRNTVANATLNINSTGAKPLFYNGVRAGVGNTWDTNEIVTVFYDGTNYQAYNVAGSNGDGVFDISTYNATGGTLATYADLEAALGVDGANIPQSLRKGGMSVKFVQSSDNKYVQYRLMADSFTTDVSQWQGVDDEPTAGSDNLVKSGGVLLKNSKILQHIGFEVEANIIEDATYVKIANPIPKGAVILSLGGYRDICRGKTNLADSEYFTFAVGSTVDRDIYYVYGRTIADIKITIDGLQYNTAEREIGNTVSPELTITTIDETSYIRLPFTIKSGNILVSRTGTGAIYGKNKLENANADGIFLNVTIEHDINYIRIAEVGTFSLQFSGIKNDTDELKKGFQSINDSIIYPQEHTGLINTSTGSWSRSNGKCYIINVEEENEIAINKKTGVANFIYAFLTDYDIPNNVISYVEGTNFVVSGYSTEIKVPATTKYLYVGPVTAVDNIIIDGVDIFKGIGNHLIDLYKKDDLLSKFNLKGTETIEELTNLSTINGYVAPMTGIIVSGNNYKTTEAIAVKKGDVLIFSAYGTSNTTILSEKLGDFYQPLLIDTGYKERRFVVEKDGDIVISTSTNYKLEVYLIKCNKELSQSKNLFVSEHSINRRNAGANGALENSGSRWISSFIPVDNKKSHYLDCNINYTNNSQSAVYQIQCYDINGAYLGLANVRGVNYSGNNLFPPILIPYNNCRYIRVNIDGRAFPYTDRDKVVLSYSNDGIAFEPHNIISDKELFIKDSQRFNVNDLEQFAANIVSGTLSESTFTNVDGIVETPDSTKLYFDVSSNLLYKYDSSAFVSLSIYDRSSKVFNTSFKFFVYAGTENMKNMIVTASARYIGSDKPTIDFKLVRNAYYGIYWGSLKFNLCENTYTKKEWRVPPTLKYMECIEVDVTIPNGTVVFVRELENYFSDKVKQWDGGFRLNGHHLCCPDQSIQYFELCAKLGYPCVITIPKVTADGVFVCYHDDDNIGRYARNADGTAIDNPQSISSYTYNELLAFDFGIYEGLQYAGTKIAKVEDLFRICAKTGMHPMFSIHPNLTNEQWVEIKDMAKRYGVLGNLNLKFASKTFMAAVYSVFGTDVESYTLDVSSNGYQDPSIAIEDVNAVGFDITKVRVGIEYFENIITKQLVEDTLSAGYFAACAEFSNNATSARYEEVISWGVTEITDDYNPCYGLNW